MSPSQRPRQQSDDVTAGHGFHVGEIEESVVGACFRRQEGAPAAARAISSGNHHERATGVAERPVFRFPGELDDGGLKATQGAQGGDRVEHGSSQAADSQRLAIHQRLQPAPERVVEPAHHLTIRSAQPGPPEVEVTNCRLPQPSSSVRIPASWAVRFGHAGRVQLEVLGLGVVRKR